MRTLPRKMRGFRPATASLEARNAVARTSVAGTPVSDDGNDVIRPMILAATTPNSESASLGPKATPDASPGFGFSRTGSGGGTSLSGSGAGGPPIVSNSFTPLTDDGIQNGTHYHHVSTYNSLVPVGSLAKFDVLTPGIPWVIDTTTIAWSGGTDYKSYFGSPATTYAPNPMQVETPTPKNLATYQFIVDATARAYSVKVIV